MILNQEEFPITIQAFEISNDKEFFVAEQVVNSQREVDLFSSRYAGKVIKAKAVTTTHDTKTTATTTSATSRNQRTKKNSGVTTIIIILIIIAILIAIGFYTGWIQQNTGITV